MTEAFGKFLPFGLHPVRDATYFGTRSSAHEDMLPSREAQVDPLGEYSKLSPWDLDHIQPIKAFKLKRPEDRAMVCHWSNLRPLSGEENRIKNGHLFTYSSY